METKFIHCGDLHLGCQPAHLEVRYNDFFISFRKLIEDAIKNKCQYILISGDLFHLKVINSKTLLKALELFDLAINNHIKIIAIEGNHDKAFYVDEDSWLEFLKAKNYITLLKHEIVDNELIINDNSIYEDDNIRIIGVGYLGSTTQMYLKNLEQKIKKSNKFTVLMLHAAVNRLCGSDMGDINIEILKPLNKVVDYIALGHIHNCYEYNDFIYNPGSLENIRLVDGRSNEKKGYYLVSYNEKKKKEVTFINSVKRKIYNLSIEINDLTFEDAKDYLNDYNYNLDKDSMLELTLYGKTKFNPYTLDFEGLKNHIKEKYNVLYIEINNYINILTNKKDNEKTVDLSKIETETINQYFRQNYPSINAEVYTNQINKIKEQILNGVEKETIISKMIEEEEIK